ncbi:myb/SANT-like DNA-binding domain-containing protein 3 [Rhagoletis pomonella]|uniref:myb/SANT-like DNA-binding domain-containing protein 3 n=1 Tax=Rhagoletis pomonella TaxID=28610 RepID=UPI0017870540|nr:myb/SANT-like DNA-binding domain-containing protein 3 [Rhagoletis pomonella]
MLVEITADLCKQINCGVILEKFKMESAARTKNFSTDDISTLLSLVRKNANILECKATGRVRVDQKEKAWENVAESFNSMCSGAPRSAKNLRTKYLNLKADMKKRSADQKKYAYGTGGGPSREPAASSIDILLSEILPEKQVQGMESKYDNDFLPFDKHSADLDHSVGTDPQQRNVQSEQVVQSQTMKEEDCVIDDMGMREQSTSKRLRASTPNHTTEKDDYEPWEHYTPMQLKTPKNKKLCTESVNRKHTSWAKLAGIKSKWTEIKLKEEVEFAKIEHTLRITQMKEVHELQKQFASEKHALEMRILSDKLKTIENT